MNKVYSEILDKIAENNFLHQHTLFNYDIEDRKDLFDKVYTEAYEHLKEWLIENNISDTTLIFDANDALNGLSNDNPYYIVGIGHGVIPLFISIYQNRDLEQQRTVSQGIQKVITNNKPPLEDLLVTYNALAIYYHELGHLLHKKINFTQKDINNCSENFPVIIPYEQFVEIDCDWVSMEQIAKRICKKHINSADLVNELQTEISLVICSLTAFMKQFTYTTEEFAIPKSGYPNPCVRLVLMQNFLIENVQKLFPNIQLDKNKILKDAKDLGRCFVDEYGFGSSQLEEMNLYVEQNRIQIEENVKEILCQAKRISKLSINQT